MLIPTAIVSERGDLIEEQILGGAAATITFLSIPQSHTHLRLLALLRTNLGAALDYTYLRFNGDSGANYDANLLYGNNNVADSVDVMGNASLPLGDTNGGSAAANRASLLDLTIPYYRDTTFYKTVHADTVTVWDTDPAGVWNEKIAGLYRSLSAITGLQLIAGSGQYIAGCRARLYGME